MTTSKRSFSNLRWIGLIALFFVVLAALPVLKSHQYEQFTEKKSSSPEVTHFPLDYSLKIFRDPTRKGSPNRGSKVTLKELLTSETPLFIINFWATWCPPCLEELPSIENLNLQLSRQVSSGKPLTAKLITISVDDRMDDISRLETTLDFKPTFAVFHDPEGELARSLGTTKFPETFLVNNRGEILYKWVGPQDWLSMDALHQLKLHSK